MKALVCFFKKYYHIKLNFRGVNVEKQKNQTIVDRIWNSFSSITLAVVFFTLISLTSMIGTVIEQNAEPEKNLKVIGKLFGESLAPTLYNIFERLGFMDMYHSWWFVTLLLLFAANLVICSIDRLPKIWKLVKEPINPLSEEHFKGVGIKREIVLRGKTEKVRGVVGTAIKNAGFNFSEAKEANGYQLYSQKGSYSRLGVYITHFSILVILLGAIIGIFFGFKGFLNLPEGAISSVAYYRSGIEQPLGFSIRCDNFLVDFYGGSDMPKAYKSWLTIIKDGKEVIKKTIEVNDPLTYEGITFYQSSYGMVPDAQGIFMLKAISKDGKRETINLKHNESFTIPGTSITGKIINFSPALGMDQTGRPFTYADMMNNPAIYIEFSEGGKQKYAGWLLKRYPETWALPDGHIVEFMDYWGIEYTGLQVRKDPGVWVVYLGCITISIGLFIAFFVSHRRLWVRLIEDKNGTRVTVGATANKNRQAFERKIDKIIALLSKSQGGGK